ncbi:MAG TPA: hypothetical protein VL326_14055 [Kofleriaceae bacterium]|jgi:hypothetical protein|nr:hypothetical protein [Kofleriaceae bacterium]
MARAKAPKKKKSPPAKPAKPKSGGTGKNAGPQMGIGDFMQDQFEANAGKKKRG